PPEHGTDSIKHGLNDRQHVSLEPRNNSLNRKHDPRPDDLNNVPQPLSTSNNAGPNSRHDRPNISLEPANNRSRRGLNRVPNSRPNCLTGLRLREIPHQGSHQQADSRDNPADDGDRLNARRNRQEHALNRQTSSSQTTRSDPRGDTSDNERTRQSRQPDNVVLNPLDARLNALDHVGNLLDETDNGIRCRFHHWSQLLQQWDQRLTDGNLDVILGDLERLTECLSNILTGFSLRRGEFTSAVLHHVENVINTDFAISGHLLDNVARGAELRRQRVNDRITRLGNHRQRVIHDDTTVVDSLQESVHGAVKFCCASTGTDDCPTNLVKNLYSIAA